jgi:hypothetical protein
MSAFPFCDGLKPAQYSGKLKQKNAVKMFAARLDAAGPDMGRIRY